MSFSSVEGSIEGMTGTIAFTEDTLEESSFAVCIKPETIDTDNEKRDSHLKNEDFFSVTEHTTVCFQSSSITKSKSGYLTKGKLILHGVTKEIEIPFFIDDLHIVSSRDEIEDRFYTLTHCIEQNPFEMLRKFFLFILFFILL